MSTNKILLEMFDPRRNSLERIFSRIRVHLFRLSIDFNRCCCFCYWVEEDGSGESFVEDNLWRIFSRIRILLIDTLIVVIIG